MSNTCQGALAFHPRGFILPAEGSGVKGEGEAHAQMLMRGRESVPVGSCVLMKKFVTFFEQSGKDVLGRGGDQHIGLSINRC